MASSRDHGPYDAGITLGALIMAWVAVEPPLPLDWKFMSLLRGALRAREATKLTLTRVSGAYTQPSPPIPLPDRL